MNVKKIIFGKQPAANTKKSNKYQKSIQSKIPVADIRDGVVITDSGQFIKIVEVLPVNFYLKSALEQHNIIAYFASYLKIAPDNMQILVITQKADIEGYISMMWTNYHQEQNPNCREMIEDNIKEVEYLAEREALTRRFFIAFRYEARMRLRNQNYESIVQRLNDEAATAKQYLDMCGLETIQPKYYDIFLTELLYSLLNKKTSKSVKLPQSIFTMTGEVIGMENIVLED